MAKNKPPETKPAAPTNDTTAADARRTNLEQLLTQARQFASGAGDTAALKDLDAAAERMKTMAMESGGAVALEAHLRNMVASFQAKPPSTQPSEDRRRKIGKMIELAHGLASDLGDQAAVSGMEDLSERLKTLNLDAAGFDDMARDLETLIQGLKKRKDEQAARPLDAATYGEKAAQLRSSEDPPQLGVVEPGTKVSTLQLTKDGPPGPGVAQEYPPEVRAVLQRLTEAADARGGMSLGDTLDQLLASDAVLRQDRATGHERFQEHRKQLEEANQRAKDADQRATDALAARDNALARSAMGHTPEGRWVEIFRELMNAPSAATGVIVENLGDEKHRVLLFTRGGEGVALEKLERGEPLPWHAAREVVQRLVDTKLTPADKR